MTLTYELASYGLSVSVPGTGIDVGAVIFPASLERAVRVEVRDALSSSVRFGACQDIYPQPQGVCGGTGEPAAFFCGTNVGTLPSTFLSGFPIHVFVWAAAPSCPGAFATTGAVTLVYEP